ncbi:MAG: hypothetical protein DME45_08325 [Verrucomicrobia bacterium]|nr:MAG: hypothetical protein DME45_08325 [Verrucomicrobiota bacterium]
MFYVRFVRRRIAGLAKDRWTERSRAVFAAFQRLGVGYKNNIWRRYSPGRPKRVQLRRPKLRSALHVVRYFGVPV